MKSLSATWTDSKVLNVDFQNYYNLNHKSQANINEFFYEMVLLFSEKVSRWGTISRMCVPGT